MRIFISHSSKDKNSDRLKLLDTLLKREGFEPWEDKELVVGDQLVHGLREAIDRCDACVFFLSQDSGKSPWCMAELGAFWGTGKPVWILCADGAPSINTVVPQFQHLLHTDNPDKVVEAAKRERTKRPKTLGEARVSEVRIDHLINVLGERVSTELGPVLQSVSQIARQIAVLTPFDKTSVFGMRYDHFFHEKQAIAKAFVDELEEHLRKRERVRLLLDAGTTVFPVFKHLADRAQQLADSADKWTRRIRIITNNIPGVLVLLRDARESSGPLNAPLLFDVCVVGGQPSADYWALLSKDPEQQIDEFIAADESNQDVVTIGVTTGNYGGSDGRTLFVRGLQHMAFKQAMLKRADVLYSLMPLGKLLPKSADEVNEMLIAGEVNEDPESKYKDLRLKTIDEKRSIIVLTTERKQNDRMYRHYTVVQTDFERGKKKGERITMSYVPFDVSAICRGDPEVEEALEMPHESHRAHLKQWFKWPTRTERWR